MSTAILANSIGYAAPQRTDDSLRWKHWVVMVVLTLCFFILGHNWQRSTWADDGFNLDAADMETQMEAGNNVWRAAITGIGCVGAVLLVWPGGYPLRPRQLLMWGMVAAVLWSGATVLWSIDPLLTVRRVYVLLCCMLGALGIAKHFSARQICYFALGFCFLVAVVGLLAELSLGTFQPWVTDYRFAGTVHPNTQAIHLATIILSVVALTRGNVRSHVVLVTVLVVASLLLILTKSRTAVGACLLGLFAIWLINTTPRTKFLSLSAVVFSISLAALVLLAAGVDDADRFAQAALLGRDDDVGSLTGRLPIWQFVADDAAKRPLHGHGFGSYWSDETMTDILSEFGWPVPDAHNSYLETTLNIGLVGLGVSLAVIVLAATSAARVAMQNRHAGHAFFVGMIAFGLSNGLLESYMMTPFNFSPLITLCGIMQVTFFASAGAGSQA